MQSTTVEGDQTEAVNYEEKGRLGEGKKNIFPKVRAYPQLIQC